MSQIMRPISDLNSTWSCSSGSSRYALINEVTPNDSNYIYIFVFDSSVKLQKCGLQAPAGIPAPGAGEIHWRGMTNPSGYGIKLEIYCGTTAIHSPSYTTMSSSYATYTTTISAEDMAKITDWNNVSVYISTAYQPMDYRVSWVEFVVPDPQPPAGLEMGMIF